MPRNIFKGTPNLLEGDHWEFSFDDRPTNLTWSWRQIGENGLTIECSAAYADLSEAVNDAVSRGFVPGTGNWVVRGVPVTPRAAARLSLSAWETAQV